MLVYTSSYRGCTFRIVKRISVPSGQQDPKNVYLDSFVCLPKDLPFVEYFKKGYTLRHLFAPKMKILSHAGPLPDMEGFWVGYRASQQESMYTHGLSWAKAVCRGIIGDFLDDDYGILHKKSDASRLRFVKPIKEAPAAIPLTMEEED